MTDDHTERDRPPADAGSPERTGRNTTDIPGMIGNYRILRKLGEGGMGVVFEAEQQNPKRLVALKMIRGGQYVDDHTIQLFEREVRALARLKHPNIAAIYENGRSDDGQHFFAMELAQGTLLSDYMRDRDTTSPSRVGPFDEQWGLFLEICHGVNYAHQRGVIHRDLKPSNVLVNPSDRAGRASPHPSGGVKILDFGLARIAGHDRDLSTVGLIKGTPAYMSPEQAGGDPDEIDLRSDVYALGVILYELTTGALPYDVGSGSPMAVIHTICTTPPRRPNDVWREAGFRVSTELERIILKALEKDPTQRYQSALALAEDIERYLHNQPILATPPGAAYQVRKLVARHRAAFGVAASVVVLTAASAVSMTLSRNRALTAERVATREGDRLQAINDFLLGMLASADPRIDGRAVKVVDVLDRAASTVDSSLAQDPYVQVTVRNTLGRTYQNLGLLDPALQQLEASIALHEGTLPDDLVGRAFTQDLLAEVQRQRGEYTTAESLHREALALRRQALGDRDPLVARSLNNLAVLLVTMGQWDEGEAMYREALDIRRTVLGDDHADVVQSRSNLATLLYARGDYGASERLFRDALAAQRRLVGPEHLDVAVGMNNLALVLTQLERGAEAESLYLQSLELQRAALGERHPEVARSYNNVGMFYYRQGAYDQAAPMIEQALTVNREVLGTSHQEVATNLNNLGLVYRDRGELPAAERALRAVLTIDSALDRLEHPLAANHLANLGAVLVRQARYLDAEDVYRAALAIHVRIHPEGHWQTATTRSLLGEALAGAGRYAAAESMLVEAHRIISDEFGQEHGRSQAALRRVVALYEAWGKPELVAEFRSLVRPRGG